MNEKIKQFAEQAGLQCSKDEAVCFAELIVEECARLVDEQEDSITIYDLVEGKTTQGDILKKQFGVK